MRSVNIAVLKNELSRYLHQVRGGEPLLIRDRNLLIAKIIPLPPANGSEAEERRLAAEGKLRLPDAPLPGSFWTMPVPRLTRKRILAAVEAERDEE